MVLIGKCLSGFLEGPQLPVLGRDLIQCIGRLAKGAFPVLSAYSSLLQLSVIELPLARIAYRLLYAARRLGAILRAD